MAICTDVALGPRLLVVEDSNEDVFFLQRALGKVGFQPPTDHVLDGALAQDYLEGRNGFGHRQGQPLPRLVLSDIKMPLCTGLELLAWIRKNPRLRHLPVVMWSSSDYEKDVHAADLGGACYYLQKPQSLGGFTDVARALQQIWTYDCAAAVQGAGAHVLPVG